MPGAFVFLSFLCSFLASLIPGFLSLILFFLWLASKRVLCLGLVWTAVLIVCLIDLSQACFASLRGRTWRVCSWPIVSVLSLLPPQTILCICGDDLGSFSKQYVSALLAVWFLSSNICGTQQNSPPEGRAL